MREDILVVGGYGAVGKHVVMELIEICPERVIIAGRDLSKANAFVQKTDLPIRIEQLDIYDIGNFNDESLKTVHTVVMCLGAKNTKFVEFCIDNGINYIDISASNEIPNQIRLLESKAIQNKVTCILGVGIAPGLSTLLATEVASKMEYVTKLDFALMLGLGEQHGTDGVRWFLENLKTDFKVNGVIIKPFTNMCQADFPEPLGKRKAYSFNLADERIISETLDISDVSTYYCYDSKFMTGLIHMVKKSGILNILRNQKIFNRFLKIFSSDKMSKNSRLSDRIGLHIKATGLSEGMLVTYHGNITGNNSSTLTAKVASYTALQLNQSNYPVGVHYLNEVMHLDEIVGALKEELSVEIILPHN